DRSRSGDGVERCPSSGTHSIRRVFGEVSLWRGEGGRCCTIAPGWYDTSINIHNPQLVPSAIFFKKLVLAPREGAKPLPPSRFRRAVLKPDFAEHVDCKLIRSMLGNQGGTPFVDDLSFSSRSLRRKPRRASLMWLVSNRQQSAAAGHGSGDATSHATHPDVPCGNPQQTERPDAGRCRT